MAKDINVGVGMDLKDFLAGKNAYVEAIRFISQQTQAAIADFNQFEEAANAVGVSVQDLNGFSDETATTYQNLAAATEHYTESVGQLENAFKRARIKALQPFAEELEEFQTILGNTASEFTDFLNGDSDGFDFDKVFGSGKAVKRVSDQAARERAAAEDFQTRKEFEARFSTQAGFDRSTAKFDARQGIDRQSFLDAQRVARLNAPGGLPFSEFKRQQAVDLARFDIRQKAAADKRDLNDPALTAQGTEKIEINTRNMSDSMKTLVDEFKAFRNLATFTQPTVKQVLGDI